MQIYHLNDLRSLDILVDISETKLSDPQAFRIIFVGYGV